MEKHNLFFIDGPAAGQSTSYDVAHFGHTIEVYIYQERPYYKCLYTLEEREPGVYNAIFKKNIK